MIIRLSQKLATKLKADALKTMPLDENPYADWSSHLFAVKRTQYILLSNTASLYSTVMYGKGMSNDHAFIVGAMSSIRDLMEDDGQLFVYQRFLVPSSGELDPIFETGTHIRK